MNRPVLPRLWLAGAALAILGALALYASGAAAAPWSFSRHMGAHLLLSLAAAPLLAARGGPAAAVLLLAQMAACALLGAAITFSRGAYPMTAPADTALGGVLMWVAGGLVVMAAAFAVLIGLLARSSAKESHEQLL